MIVIVNLPPCTNKIVIFSFIFSPSLFASVPPTHYLVYYVLGFNYDIALLIAFATSIKTNVTGSVHYIVSHKRLLACSLSLGRSDGLLDARDGATMATLDYTDVSCHTCASRSCLWNYQKLFQELYPFILTSHPVAFCFESLNHLIFSSVQPFTLSFSPFIWHNDYAMSH